LEQLSANRSVYETTHRFALGDYIVEVILETSNIVASVGIIPVTLKGHSDLIVSEGDVVDSGRGDLHFKE